MNLFYEDITKKKGRDSLCKSCKLLYAKIYYQKNAEARRAYSKEYKKKNPEKIRAANYYHRYNGQVKPEDIPIQCQICKKEKRKIHVDHCHKTGKVRGFLCPSCNISLGMAQDDPSILIRMAEYLRNS